MKKGEKRKQELLQIAYSMFIQRGYENTSVDDIIEAAGIAKGTYYYYFESKEQTLEEVIGMMIEKEREDAEKVVEADIPIPQKIVGIIASLKPSGEEHPIEGALMQPENILMHKKVIRKLIDIIVPLLSGVVEEGIAEGIFSCDNIPERVKMLMLISNDLFNEGAYTDRDIEVFIDTAEKLLGAEKGSMGFIRGLIS